MIVFQWKFVTKRDTVVYNSSVSIMNIVWLADKWNCFMFYVAALVKNTTLTFEILKFVFLNLYFSCDEVKMMMMMMTHET